MLAQTWPNITISICTADRATDFHRLNSCRSRCRTTLRVSQSREDASNLSLN